MSGVLMGFLPWIVYWIVSGFGATNWAVAGGLITALGLIGWRVRSRNLKTMEVVTLVFFAANFIATVLLGLPLFKTYDAILVNGTLTLMAFGSLIAGSPFTYEYARESVPREFWNQPLFRRTNEIITAVWGAIFVADMALGAISIALPEAKLFLMLGLANALIAGGIIFSSIFPNWYPRRVIAKEIAARDPWESPAFAPTRPTAPNEHDVIVIGSGMGGLSAAALLAKRGLKVAVFEQHFLPGGFCTSWERGVRRDGQRLRYVFDAGVHDISGLGARGAVRNLLRQLDIEDRIEWRRTHHEYILPGLRLQVPERAEEFVAQLGQQFPAERARIAEFFAEIEKVYREMYADVEKTGGVPGQPRTVADTLAYPKKFPTMYRWMNVPFGTMLDTYLRDARLKEFLSTLTGYLSDDPKVLTVGAMAPIFGYYFDGGFYPVGGSQSLPNTLVQVIEENGGKVFLRTPVERILLEGQRAVGVQLANGAAHCAPAIVSNADARRTFLELVGRTHLPAELARQAEALTPSTSAFMVFLGVDFVPAVAPITLFSAGNDGVGITIPSKEDPTLAPAGHASMTLIALLPPSEAATWDRSAPGYNERKRRYGDKLIALAEQAIPDLRAHIVYRQDASPATFTRYAGVTQGAIYGPAVGQQFALAKSPITRLYLAGSGTFPGAGIEAVVIAGTLAADAIYRGN